VSSLNIMLDRIEVVTWPVTIISRSAMVPFGVSLGLARRGEART
jgi:hypothetical protein